MDAIKDIDMLNALNKENDPEEQEENDKAVFNPKEQKPQLDHAKSINAKPDKNSKKEELLLDKINATNYKSKRLMFAEIKLKAKLDTISHNDKGLVPVFMLYIVRVLGYILTKEKADGNL